MLLNKTKLFFQSRKNIFPVHFRCTKYLYFSTVPQQIFTPKILRRKGMKLLTSRTEIPRLVSFFDHIRRNLSVLVKIINCHKSVKDHFEIRNSQKIHPTYGWDWSYVGDGCWWKMHVGENYVCWRKTFTNIQLVCYWNNSIFFSQTYRFTNILFFTNLFHQHHYSPLLHWIASEVSPQKSLHRTV